MTWPRRPVAGRSPRRAPQAAPPSPLLRPLSCVALLLLSWGVAPAARAEPRVHRIGVAVTDAVDRRALPPHLLETQTEIRSDLNRRVRDLLNGLGRFETAPWFAVADGRRYSFSGHGSVDLICHVTLHDLRKIYRNDSLMRLASYGVNASAMGEPPGPYEIISQPAIIGRLEIELVDPGNGKVIWSILRDSTAIVPHDPHLFLYNPSKFPRVNHPDLISAHLADIIRLQAGNYALQSAMANAERWFVSTPDNDVATTRGLLAGLVAAGRAELDANLPLEGHLVALLPDEDGEARVLLSIGWRDGVTPRLRLDLWRPLPSDEKVGQIEVVAADSTSATARVRKIDRKLRQRGEGPAPGDRAISRKRRVGAEETAP